jgi:hypothetical protein
VAGRTVGIVDGKDDDVKEDTEDVDSRLQTNRGYKKTNRNTDFLLMIFVSYSRIRIFKKGIRIRMKGIRIFKKPIPFIRNRIQKIYRIIRIQTNRILFIRI